MKSEVVGMLGSVAGIGLFFLALANKDSIRGAWVVVYPISLFFAYSSIGIFTSGSLKNGLKRILQLLLMFIGIFAFTILARLLQEW